MQRGRGWSSRWRDRGERECAGRVVKTVEKNDNPYNIPVFLLRTNRKRLGGGGLDHALCLAVVLHRTLFIIYWEFTAANNKALTNEQSPCRA